MARELKINPPRLPDTLPFESRLDDALDSLALALERNSFTQELERLRSRVPEIAEIDMPTPLGRIKTPRLALPSFSPPKIDDRRKEIVKAAVLDDIASLLGMIPGVGTVAGIFLDSMEDTAMAKIDETLAPREKNEFHSADKVSPSTVLSTLITFAKVR